MADATLACLLDILDARTRHDLMTRGRKMRVSKGQSVVTQNGTSSDAFVILEGRMQAVLYSANGREVSLREMGPGQLFGELGAIDGRSRSVGIVALTQGRLLMIDRATFRALIRNSPDAAEWLAVRLTSQIRGLTERVFELSALSVRTRLHCELIRIGRADPSPGTPSPTHAELANRIGSHREAVTRELRMLADRKIIRSGRRRLDILDMAGLEAEIGETLSVPIGDGGRW